MRAPPSHVHALVCALSAWSMGCDVGMSAGSVPLPRDPPKPGAQAVIASTTSSIVAGFAAHTRPESEARVYVEDVVTGASHACVRAFGGTVRCWGSNEHGQLGRSTGPFDPTPALAGHGALSQGIFAGPTQTAVLDDTGQLGHWGLYAPRNDDGVTPWSKHDTPGVEALEGVAFGEHFALAWDRAGRLIGWGAPDGASFTTAFIIKPVIIHLGFGVAQASVWSRDGAGHGCIVVNDGSVACWGRDSHGELGRGPMERGIFRVPEVRGVSRVSVGERFSCALRGDRTVWCWGSNDAGQLGDGSARHTGTPVRVAVSGEVTGLATGAHHACVLTRSGAVWCWGSNDAGQLGAAGVELLSAVPVLVEGLPKATGVAAGDRFSCARTEDGRAFCWGDNDQGQLGDGTTLRRAAPRPVLL